MQIGNQWLIFKESRLKLGTLFSALLYVFLLVRLFKEMVVTDRQKIFLDKSPNIFNILGQLGHNIHKMSK